MVIYVSQHLFSDGDLYSLLWDPRLLITKVAPPMDYTAQIPERSNHPVTIEQIKQVNPSDTNNIPSAYFYVAFLGFHKE